MTAPRTLRCRDGLEGVVVENAAADGASWHIVFWTEFSFNRAERRKLAPSYAHSEAICVVPPGFWGQQPNLLKRGSC